MPRVLRSRRQRQPRSVSSVEQSDRRNARPGQIRHVGAGSGDRDGSANGPSSKLARGGRSCSWICPFPPHCRDDERRPSAGAPQTGVARALPRSLLAAIAAALAPPPAALAEADAGGRSTFAALASAAIVALAILPFIVWRGAARPPIWLAVAIAALALGVGSFSAGGYVQRACTARYGGQTGHHRHGSDDARSGLRAGEPRALERRHSCSMRPACRSGSGPAAPIGRCRAFISSTYFLWIPFLVVCLVATAQACRPAMLAPVRWDAPAPQAARRTAPLRYDVFLSYRHDGEDSEFRDRAGLSARSRRLPGGDRRARLPGQRQLPAGNGTLDPRKPFHGGGDLAAVSRERQLPRKKRSSARCSTWATESAG